jgi:hypothetical protein
VALSVNRSIDFSLCSSSTVNRAPIVRDRRITNSSLCYRSPGVTRRVALPCSCSAGLSSGISTRKVVSGLSSRLAACATKPAIIQLTRHLHYIAQTHVALSFHASAFLVATTRMVTLGLLFRQCMSAKPRISSFNKRFDRRFFHSITFSDLEKRMMYFTESGEMSEDPFELNDAFETGYDPTEYEAKVPKLIAHAYARLKKEDYSLARIRNEAIQEIHKVDHSLLKLWGHQTGGSLQITKSFWK